jgi:hypothetical protein
VKSPLKFPEFREPELAIESHAFVMKGRSAEMISGNLVLSEIVSGLRPELLSHVNPINQFYHFEDRPKIAIKNVTSDVVLVFIRIAPLCV